MTWKDDVISENLTAIASRIVELIDEDYQKIIIVGVCEEVW